MDKEGIGFRDIFVYVIPGGLYLLAVLAWYPGVLQKLTEQDVALVSIGFVFVAYAIGFSTYWLSYLIRYLLPDWREENEEVITKIIHVISEFPEFFEDEIFRYRNLCRVCLSLAVPSLCVGVSWSVDLYSTQRGLSIFCFVASIVITVSLLYRAVRYNKRYLKQIDLAYAELQKQKSVEVAKQG